MNEKTLKLEEIKVNILVLNFGSFFVKFQLFNITEEKKEPLVRGMVENIGIGQWELTYYAKDKEKIIETFEDVRVPTIVGDIIVKFLTDKKYSVITSKTQIDVVGDRVVHGSEFFSELVVFTDEVKQKIKECISFVPLHNPYNLCDVEQTEEVLPNVPQVAVSDTFHSTMPSYAFIFALSFNNYYKKYETQRYGFYSTSYRYASNRTVELMIQPIEKLKIITCHLTNSASVCAVRYGKSVVTSMKFTSLEGFVMGARCCSIDPVIVLQNMACEKSFLYMMLLQY